MPQTRDSTTRSSEGENADLGKIVNLMTSVFESILLEHILIDAQWRCIHGCHAVLASLDSVCSHSAAHHLLDISSSVKYWFSLLFTF